MAVDYIPCVSGGPRRIVSTAFQAFHLPTPVDESDDVDGDKFLSVRLRSRYFRSGCGVFSCKTAKEFSSSLESRQLDGR